MVHKRWSLGILALALILAFVLSGAFLRQDVAASPDAQGEVTNPAAPDGPNDPQQTITPPAAEYNSYAAKFVCGAFPTPTAANVFPPVQPGNYSTEINIHNPNYPAFHNQPTTIRVYKKLVILAGATTNAAGQIVPFIFREPEMAQPLNFVQLDMRPDSATMDDCQALWRMANQTGLALAPGQPTIGYLVLLSPKRYELDVDAVYTGELPGSGSGPVSLTEDVVRVTGKLIRKEY